MANCGGHLPMIGWQQDYVCWKCRDRISCPPDNALLWDWIRTPDVTAFEAKHKACDDGKSVGLELMVFDMDAEQPAQEAGRSIAIAGSNGGRGAA